VSEYLLPHLVTVITALVVTLIIVRLLGTDRAPQSLVAWLLGLIFVPMLAVPAFLLFGTRKFPRHAKRAMNVLQRDIASEPAHPVARVMRALGSAPLRDGNQFELLSDGVQAYTRLLDLVATAQHSITMNMFILGDDAVGWALLHRLAERARQGVSVRLVLDAVGSGNIMRRAKQHLAAAGGEVRSFMPLIHAPVRGRTNLRCHRKLIVCDDQRVFLGGMNVALEYMGPEPLEGRWVDLAAIVSGTLARDASAVFESDWAFCGGQVADDRARPEAPVARTDAGAMQLVPSGPDMSEDTFYNGLLAAFATARSRIAIVTPYYVPDDVVQRSLMVAARRGVRTQLIVPTRSNHFLADFARRGLLRELARAGVELYFYAHGMVHAKAMLVDDAFAYIGSPNIDMRSLFLNYEDALFMYDPAQVAMVEVWINALLARSTGERPKAKREFWLLEQLARIVAPEL
jgi:cardiolipin synthase